MPESSGELLLIILCFLLLGSVTSIECSSSADTFEELSCPSFCRNTSYGFYGSERCTVNQSLPFFPSIFNVALGLEAFPVYIMLDLAPLMVYFPVLILFNINLASGPGQSFLFFYQALTAATGVDYFWGMLTMGSPVNYYIFPHTPPFISLQYCKLGAVLVAIATWVLRSTPSPLPFCDLVPFFCSVSRTRKKWHFNCYHTSFIVILAIHYLVQPYSNAKHNYIETLYLVNLVLISMMLLINRLTIISLGSESKLTGLLLLAFILICLPIVICVEYFFWKRKCCKRCRASACCKRVKRNRRGSAESEVVVQATSSEVYFDMREVEQLNQDWWKLYVIMDAWLLKA